MKHFTTSLILSSLSIISAGAVTVFDDAVDGFASSSGASPTALTFASGTNSILGTVSSGGGGINNVRNFYTFTIGAGQTLDSITLSAINVTTSAGALSNDPGFFALVSGNTASTPGAGFANLGGALYDPSDEGLDLLSQIADGGISDGTGFTTIGPGDFTFVIQQTGTEISNFQLDFEVSSIPEPSTTGTLLLGSLLLLGRRNRR